MAVLLFICLCQLVTSILASPFFTHEAQELFHHSTKDRLERRQGSTGTVAITGVKGLGAPPRLEIRQLQKNTDQWNLYILGLDRFMKTSQDDRLSYYEIAAYDGVGPQQNTSNGPGYCTHLSNIFLPWHRPYLALYEQVLYSHIIDAVNSFPSGSVRAKYAQAALSWRQPYWDWAALPSNNDSVYPSILSTQTIQVTLPNGTANISNPLYSFQFHPVSVDDFYYNPFATWSETKRYPTAWTKDATSQDDLIGPMLDKNRQSLMDRVYNLFTNYNNFTEFGNEAWYFGNKVENADSLESLHDAIHGITGSSGHMTYLDYSAFDPLFWLHHTMIDRLFALFQALNPDSYVEPMQALEQTFTIWSGESIDVNTPLDPFHSDTSGTKYTSQTARGLTSFGYTYPELMGNNASAVRAAINKQYGSSPGSGVLSKRWFSDDVTRHGHNGRANSYTSLASTPGETSNDGKRNEYILNIASEKFALNGSYAIYVFLGSVDNNDPSTWATTRNLVGTHAVFAALPGEPHGSGLRKRAMSNVLVTGTMPLTSVLLSKAQGSTLKGMDVESVADYLSKNLRMRVATFNNTEVPANQVPGLNFAVVRAKVKPAASTDAFPVWDNFVELKNINISSSGNCAA